MRVTRAESGAGMDIIGIGASDLVAGSRAEAAAGRGVKPYSVSGMESWDDIKKMKEVEVQKVENGTLFATTALSI